jgi:EAL domain-containing protein (putative c-di-GMP-specific phosphodiesterase class I)
MLNHSFRLTASDIDRAFEAGHFFALFQPKISVATREVIGVEAFVRWRHPSFGLMPPGLFLTFVEQQGRMRELTELIITLSSRAVREFRSAGRKWGVSINLSAADISDPRLTATIKTIVGLQGLTPDILTLEVPEHALPTAGSRDETNLRELKKLGCHIALDTGPVSPARPQTIPAKLFDELKIGGSAIIRFAHSVRKASMSALAMKLHAARSAGLTAVAVGVEDEETFRALSELGFTGAQGAFIQRALTIPALLAWDGAWLEGTPHVSTKAEIEISAKPEDTVGLIQPTVSSVPNGPRTAAELIQAVEATARANNAPRNEPPLDLDADDESDAYDDEDAEQLDQPSGPVGFGAIQDEPEGEPEIGSAESAPPLTSGMIGRPKAKLVATPPRPEATLQPVPERWRDEPSKPTLGQSAGLKTLFGGQRTAPKR